MYVTCQQKWVFPAKGCGHFLKPLTAKTDMMIIIIIVCNNGPFRFGLCDSFAIFCCKKSFSRVCSHLPQGPPVFEPMPYTSQGCVSRNEFPCVLRSVFCCDSIHGNCGKTKLHRTLGRKTDGHLMDTVLYGHPWRHRTLNVSRAV